MLCLALSFFKNHRGKPDERRLSDLCEHIQYPQEKPTAIEHVRQNTSRAV